MREVLCLRREHNAVTKFSWYSRKNLQDAEHTPRAGGRTAIGEPHNAFRSFNAPGHFPLGCINAAEQKKLRRVRLVYVSILQTPPTSSCITASSNTHTQRELPRQLWLQISALNCLSNSAESCACRMRGHRHQECGLAVPYSSPFETRLFHTMFDDCHRYS